VLGWPPDAAALSARTSGWCSSARPARDARPPPARQPAWHPADVCRSRLPARAGPVPTVLARLREPGARHAPSRNLGQISWLALARLRSRARTTNPVRRPDAMDGSNLIVVDNRPHGKHHSSWSCAARWPMLTPTAAARLSSSSKRAAGTRRRFGPREGNVLAWPAPADTAALRKPFRSAAVRALPPQRSATPRNESDAASPTAVRGVCGDWATSLVLPGPTMGASTTRAGAT
jgi:hypothetical protein